MNHRPKITDVNYLFFIFVMIFMIFQVMLTIIGIFISMFYGHNHMQNFLTDNFYIITLFSEYVIILMPVIIFILLKKHKFKEALKIKNPGILPLILIVLASVPAYVVALMFNNIVIYFLQFFGEIPYNQVPVPQNVFQLFIGIFVVALTPAICEEFMHRGLFLSAYERRGSYRAIIITAVFFGLFHFDITNLLGPVFLGLVIGYYVIRTNSIFAGILAHLLNNTIAQLLQYFTRDTSGQGNGNRLVSQDMFYLILVGLLAIIILFVIMVLFNLSTKRKAQIMPPLASLGQDVISVFTHWPVVIVIITYIIMACLSLYAIVYVT